MSSRTCSTSIRHDSDRGGTIDCYRIGYLIEDDRIVCRSGSESYTIDSGSFAGRYIDPGNYIDLIARRERAYIGDRGKLRQIQHAISICILIECDCPSGRESRGQYEIVARPSGIDHIKREIDRVTRLLGR